MTRTIRHTLNNVGRMLDISPRGKGPAAKRLAISAHVLRKRSDAAMLREDVNMVGQDLFSALDKSDNVR